MHRTRLLALLLTALASLSCPGSGVLGKSGAFYSYGDMRIGQGRENAKQFLDDNGDLRDRIEADVRKEAGLGGPPAVVAAAVEVERETRRQQRKRSA